MSLSLDPFSLDIDQLEQIWKITGTPTQEFISKLEYEDVSLNSAKQFGFRFKKIFQVFSEQLVQYGTNN